MLISELENVIFGKMPDYFAISDIAKISKLWNYFGPSFKIRDLLSLNYF